MMESVDKLRTLPRNGTNWFGAVVTASEETIEAIADEIEAEIAETEAFCRRVEESARNNDELDVFGVAYMPLPTDADGVPIRVGDEIEQRGHTGNVWLLGANEIMCTDRVCYPIGECRHVKPRTLEDVLEEYYDKRGWDEADNCALDADELTAKYAEEIRELLGGDVE